MASQGTLNNAGSAKMNIETIKKNLARRTFNINFDLDRSDYKPIENIGIGAYGVVCSAIHKKSNDRVAIKKIPHVFEAEIVTKRTYREIRILKHFKHDNIIRIREILKPREEKFKEIYVVFDLMESDLHRIIYTEQELTEEHIRYFLYQVLRGLKYIHSASVIHRDLKPSNLLVNEDCHVRIGDFGMARGVSQTPDEPCYFMTQYVATRWYRAPEILLSLVEYGSAVDMWSVGCIFAEMLGRKHLFPGKSYLNQIKLIVGVLGSPSEVVLNGSHNDLVRRIIKSLGPKQAVPWRSLFPKASKKALDLLSKMLTINPEERISAETALEHHYLSQYHDPDDEPICVPTFNFDFERKNLTKSEIHDAIYKEIMEFHQPKTPTLSFNAVLRPAPKPETLTATEEKPVDPNLSLPSKQLQEDMNITLLRDAVFKKPGSPLSPGVSVDTTTVLHLQSADVEMLSARSTDAQLDVNNVAVTPEKQDEIMQKKKVQQGENKTISMDTKALVKQALLNSSQRRQRSESSGEDPEIKPKAVTAAQRQKEREERRKKKKEKANERLKKQREKQNSTNRQLLSSEDKELLKRWTTMAPLASITVQPLQVGHQGSDLTPMTQSLIQSSKVQTTILQAPITHLQTHIQQSTSMVTAGSLQCHQTTILPTSIVEPHMLTASASQKPTATKNQSAPQGTYSLPLQTQNPKLTEPCPASFIQDTSQLSVSIDSNRSLHPNNGNNSCMFQSVTPATEFTLTTGDIPIQTTLPSQLLNPCQSDIHTTPTQYAGNISPLQLSFTQTRNNVPISTLNSNIIHTDTTADSTALQAIDFDGIDFFKDMVNEGNAQTATTVQVQPGFEFQPYPDQLPEPGISDQHNSKSTGAHNITSSPIYNPSSCMLLECRDELMSREQSVLPFSTYTQTTPQIPAKIISPNPATAQIVSQSDGQSSSHTIPPPLKISCTHPPTEPDLIAVLSKRFSKSHVEDIMPPALSLTPKGTGGGYGVGADLDSLMVDTQEYSARLDQSPLSSSLLADWLDVRGNISLADLEALERELEIHSPMAVSYTDINMHPP